MLPRRTIVLGGARSGKSTFAERLVEYSGKPKVYLATSQGFDAEMQARIARHRARRGGSWRLVEEPLDAAGALAAVASNEVVLFDCATLWLSNHMLRDTDPAPAAQTLLAAITACPGDLVVVSNEVGHGIVPDNALARAFRDEQGLLNQRLAALAGLAVFVAAGLPLVLKGRLPDGFT